MAIPGADVRAGDLKPLLIGIRDHLADLLLGDLLPLALPPHDGEQLLQGREAVLVQPQAKLLRPMPQEE